MARRAVDPAFGGSTMPQAGQRHALGVTPQIVWPSATSTPPIGGYLTPARAAGCRFDRVFLRITTLSLEGLLPYFAIC